MKTSFWLAAAIVFLPFAANAQTKTFVCERFQSKCSADACYQLISGFQKDVDKKIFTVKKTETVDYVISDTEAVETLRGEQAVHSDDRQMVLTYKSVADEHGKIVLSNKDKKGAVNVKVEIEPTSGFYLNFLIHTDGSIKDVPIGEPYLAYFGWCTSPDAPAAAQPQETVPPQAVIPPAPADPIPASPTATP